MFPRSYLQFFSLEILKFAFRRSCIPNFALRSCFAFFGGKYFRMPTYNARSQELKQLYAAATRTLPSPRTSVVDPDPYWIRIQELPGSGSTHANIG